jgi:hypothetical protein
MAALVRDVFVTRGTCNKFALSAVSLSRTMIAVPNQERRVLSNFVILWWSHSMYVLAERLNELQSHWYDCSFAGLGSSNKSTCFGQLGL